MAFTPIFATRLAILVQVWPAAIGCALLLTMVYCGGGGSAALAPEFGLGAANLAMINDGDVHPSSVRSDVLDEQRAMARG